MAIFQMTFTPRVVYSIKDSAIDQAASKLEEYQSTLRREHLNFTDGEQPTRFTIRALHPDAHDELEIETLAPLATDTEKPGTAWLLVKKRCRQAFAIGCHRVSGFTDEPIVQVDGQIPEAARELIPDAIIREIGEYVLRMTIGEVGPDPADDVGKS